MARSPPQNAASTYGGFRNQGVPYWGAGNPPIKTSVFTVLHAVGHPNLILAFLRMYTKKSLVHRTRCATRQCQALPAQCISSCGPLRWGKDNRKSPALSAGTLLLGLEAVEVQNCLFGPVWSWSKTLLLRRLGSMQTVLEQLTLTQKQRPSRQVTGCFRRL